MSVGIGPWRCTLHQLQCRGFCCKGTQDVATARGDINQKRKDNTIIIKRTIKINLITGIIKAKSTENTGLKNLKAKIRIMISAKVPMMN